MTSLESNRPSGRGRLGRGHLGDEQSEQLSAKLHACLLPDLAAQEILHAAVQIEPAFVDERFVRVVRNTISSYSTLCARSRSTSPIVCENSTLRSSSPCQSSTGDFHLSIAEIADDWYETSAVSSELPQRCTPAMSTPAANTSELRASACAVSTPPYDSPQMPTRLGSTSARAASYFPAAITSLYSALPRPPAFGAVRNDLP